MIRIKHVASASLLAAAFPLSAFAQSTQNVQVQVQVQQNCSINVPVNADFGPQTPLSTTNMTTPGSVELRCNMGAAPLLAVNNGANASGAQRRMKDAGTGYVNYTVKQPTIVGTNFTACPGFAAGTDWTSASTLAAGPAFASSGGSRNVSVCFQATVDENTPIATYSDTVAVSFSF